MKKFSFLIFLTMFTLTSCIINTGGKSNKQNKNNTDDNQTEEELSSVVLQNDSIFTTKVFDDSLRENQVCVLRAGESKTISPNSISVNGESIFYITYYVDLGIEIPWYANESYIVTIPKKEIPETYKIKTPLSMSTKNCYILLENSSLNSIVFKQGSAELYTDESKTTTILSPGKKGAYEIKYGNFSNFPSFKIATTNSDVYDLPSNIVSFEEGKIYSITVTNKNDDSLHSSLKTISPFDIDINKQIWSFTDSSFNPDYPCILRNSVSNDGSNLIMGTSAKDSTYIGYKILDKYNSESKLYTFKIQHKEDSLLSSEVLDFVQTDDKSIVMLLQNTYRDKTDNEDYSIQFISCIDFDKQELKDWSLEFSEEMVFRTNSKNKFIYTNNGIIAIAGAVLLNDEMHRYFATLDITSENPVLTQFVSSDFTSISNKIETMFSSVWYDGTNFYVCGYDNWDTSYTELSHKGIIYKFNPSDLSDNQEVYSCDRVLFFGIDGSDNNWYACGEYADTGKLLKGCYISKKMADDGKDPVKYLTYSTNRSYCYFTQLCCYQNKIIVAGKASDSFDETKNPLPIIVAFDKSSDEILWENTSFTKYSDINAIIPNLIGTYVVQLQSNSHFHYVSADLLGNEKR